MATKLEDVHVGDIWIARVSGNLVQVRVDADQGYSDFVSRHRANTHRGFTCTNLATRKVITCHIQRLRRLVSRQAEAKA